MNYTEAYSTYGIKCALAPDVPNNEGSFRPVTITAPVGSILNCQPPAPVAGRHIVGQWLPAVVHGALAQAIPDQVIADGSSSLWITQFSGSDNRQGGDGAGAEDGSRWPSSTPAGWGRARPRTASPAPHFHPECVAFLRKSSRRARRCSSWNAASGPIPAVPGHTGVASDTASSYVPMAPLETSGSHRSSTAPGLRTRTRRRACRWPRRLLPA